MVAILVVQLMAPCVRGGTSQASSETKTYSLPWHIIAEKVAEQARFCESTRWPDNELRTKRNHPEGGPDVDLNYACLPSEPVIARLAVGPADESPLRKIDMEVAKWADGLWKDVGRASADIDSDLIKVADGVGEEGFFRLKFAPDVPERGQFDLEAYAVVSGEWKRDILAFCRELKEQIETSPDEKLIFSSIATSHFDHVMDLASEGSFLSGRMLQALVCAIENKRKFEAGACPDLVVGLNKMRLKRFEGAKITEFVVFVPEHYDGSRKWPVLLVVTGGPEHYDGARKWPVPLVIAGEIDEVPELINVGWVLPGHVKEFEWKDWEYVFNFLKTKLNVDEDRIYLDAFCGFGIGAMAIALHYPDRFAECNTSAGNSYRHLAGNALNLLVFHTPHDEHPELLPYSKFVMECFKYYGCRSFNSGQERLTEVRNRSPQRVLCTIDSLDNPGAYWVRIEGRKDENFPATLDACVWGQTLLVRTKNIDAYSLDISQAPIDSGRPIEVVEDGVNLGYVTGSVFSRKPEAYASATYVKNERLHGPVWDAFRDPYVVVWGTSGKDVKFSEVSETLAKSLSNGAPCFADTNMVAGLVDSHNLILVGTAESNLWLAKISKDLPVRLEQGCITANGKRHEAQDMGYILIYPNPINPDKYVVVFSATSSAAMAQAERAYSQMKPKQSSDFVEAADVGIFEVIERGEIKWHIMENFTTAWGWHKHWNQVLAAANKKHPKWQWRQWVAGAVREQFGVDVGICTDPFKYSDSMPAGEVTSRDLFNSFRNDWIIKVEVKGRSLKELLLAPFDSASVPRAAIPIIDGVTATGSQQDGESKALPITALQDNLTYTAAMPYKLINGELLGAGLAEYKIVGEDYLVCLLRDHLCGNKDSGLDAQLDGMKLNIF